MLSGSKSRLAHLTQWLFAVVRPATINTRALTTPVPVEVLEDRALVALVTMA
jgi:hypothetical protein